jgi:ATP phosphoribosyltransferase
MPPSQATMHSNGVIRIAMQKAGRLSEGSLALLKRMGLEFETYHDRLFAQCRNLPIDILFLRDDDIPEYVQDRIVDLGIVGSNLLDEQDSGTLRLLPLDFGYCTLSLAAPEHAGYASPAALRGKRIATSYPRILRRYLTGRKIEADIVLLKGSVEIAPALQVADAICDLVATGSTLRTNRLCVLDAVAQCQAMLIGHPEPTAQKQSLIDKLLIRARSVQDARCYKYIMFNAPAQALDPIRQLVPGCKSPTVMSLADQGMIAVHSLVLEESFWDVIDQIRQLGGSDILVVPVEKFIR